MMPTVHLRRRVVGVAAWWRSCCLRAAHDNAVEDRLDDADRRPTRPSRPKKRCSKRACWSRRLDDRPEHLRSRSSARFNLRLLFEQADTTLTSNSS